MHDVDAADAVRARVAVDLDLGRGRAVGEVLERRALHGLGVPVQAGGAVVAGGEQLHALEVRRLRDLGERQPLLPAEGGHEAAAEAHVALVDAQQAAGHRGHPLADLIAGVLHRAAVEVGTRRRRRGRRVGHLVGAGRGEAHLVQLEPEGGGGDLQHLGVQTLAHLGSAVVDEHRAVLVDVHEGAGLVERREVERDAELDRRHRDRALHIGMLRVERLDLGAPLCDRRLVGELVPDRRHPLGVLHELTVRRALTGPVEVAAAQLERIDAESRGDPAEDVLDEEHALRPAEAAVGGVRLLVRLRDAPVGVHVRNPVGVVEVAERAAQHRLRQVDRPAAVGGEHRVERLQHAVLVEADLPADVERMPLAGHREVLRAVQSHPHRAPGELGAERGDGREAVRLHLLAAEAAAHAQALHGDLVGVDAEHVRDEVLRLGGVLRRALDEVLPLRVAHGERRVRLEVEVLLTGELGDTLEDVRRGGQRRSRVTPLDGARGAHERLRLDGVVHGDQRGQLVVLDLHLLGAETRGLGRLAEHPHQRVAVEHRLAREERLVVADAGVIEPGHVVGGEHPHDARHLVGAGDVDGHARVRAGGLHRPGGEHAGGLRGDVVGVHRRSGDVQRRTLVRRAVPDDGVLGAVGESTHADTSFDWMTVWL